MVVELNMPSDLRAEYAAAHTQLINYLHNGSIDEGYKEGNIPNVSEYDVRDLLLNAGYTELALTLGYGPASTDLIQSKRHPQSPEQKFTINIYGPDRYHLGIGEHDGVQALLWVAETKTPDILTGRDVLRDNILHGLRQHNILKQELERKGKKP